MTELLSLSHCALQWHIFAAQPGCRVRGDNKRRRKWQHSHPSSPRGTAIMESRLGAANTSQLKDCFLELGNSKFWNAFESHSGSKIGKSEAAHLSRPDSVSSPCLLSLQQTEAADARWLEQKGSGGCTHVLTTVKTKWPFTNHNLCHTESKDKKINSEESWKFCRAENNYCFQPLRKKQLTTWGII